MIASVVAIALFLLRGDGSGRHLAIRRLAGLVFAGCWVVAVLAPDLVTRLANTVGVGRGADLLLYVLVVAFFLTLVALNKRLGEQDRRITQLTRALAIRDGMARPTRPDEVAAAASSRDD
nr:DUF2304 domain-containing protein [Nocardioides luti]